jgi:hypothetical protein
MPKKDRKIKSIDYEPEVEERLAELAKEFRVPISQLRNFLIAWGIVQIDGEDDEIWSKLTEAFEASDSLNYKHNINLAGLLKKIKERKNKGDD